MWAPPSEYVPIMELQSSKSWRLNIGGWIIRPAEQKVDIRVGRSPKGGEGGLGQKSKVRKVK